MLEVVDHSAELFMASLEGDFKRYKMYLYFICLRVQEEATRPRLISGPYSVNMNLQKIFSGNPRIMELLRL